LESDGSFSGRLHHTWYSEGGNTEPTTTAAPIDPAKPAPVTPMKSPFAKESSTTKLQAQFTNNPSQYAIEHDHIGADFTFNVKAINPNPIDRAASYNKPRSSTCTGIYSASYLQSITPSLALGAEYVYQRPTPDMEEAAVTYVAKYTPRFWKPTSLPPAIPQNLAHAYPPVYANETPSVLTGSYSPSNGLIHTSYYQRINSRLELATELQMLVTPGSMGGEGRREGIASVGFKLDTLFSTVRGMVDTSGRVSAVLEERLAQGLALQVC